MLLFNHRAIMTIWLVVFALLALAESRTTFITMGVVLLLVAGAAQTMMLVAWKEHHPALAAPTSPGPPKEPSSDVAPNSWPNSAFRNTGRRGTGRA